MYYWRPLADRAYTSGAAWWTIHELVLAKFVRLICKVAPLVDMSCNVAPLRNIQKLILSKFVCLIFLNYVKMALAAM